MKRKTIVWILAGVAAITFVFWQTAWTVSLSRDIPPSALVRIAAFCDQNSSGLVTKAYPLPAELRMYSLTGKVYRTSMSTRYRVFYVPTRTFDRPMHFLIPDESGVEGYIYDNRDNTKKYWSILGPQRANPETMAILGLVGKRQVSDHWYVAAFF
jgi:hypothetical protein